MVSIMIVFLIYNDLPNNALLTICKHISITIALNKAHLKMCIFSFDCFIL